MIKTIAAIDFGTNTLNTIVANQTVDKIEIIEENYQIINFGEGIVELKSISNKAIERCIKGFEIVADILKKNKVSIFKCTATSALRDAKNGNEIIDLIFKKFQIKINIISGIKEARLITKATLNEFNLSSKLTLIFDIGGGSTELIFLENNNIINIESLNIGSARCTDAYLKTDPVMNYELEKLENHIDNQLNLIPSFKVNLAIGIAGTVTTLSAVKLGLETYNSDLIHKSKLSLKEIKDTKNLFHKNQISDRKKIKGLAPKRAEVILAGNIICEKIMKKFAINEMLVSDRGLRWGLLYEMLDD